MAKSNLSKSLLSILSVLTAVFCATPALATKVLDGRIDETSTTGSGTGLRPSGTPANFDPFAATAPTPSTRQAVTPAPPRPTRAPIRSPFDVEPSQDEPNAQNPQPGARRPAASNSQPAPNRQTTSNRQPIPSRQAPSSRQQASPPAQHMPTLQSENPEESGEMKIAWKQWHSRVAAAIYARFQHFSRAEFRGARPMAAVVAYSVTRDGKIVNAHLTKQSDPRYDTMVLNVVNSLNGNQVLQFPQGSQRTEVAKIATFDFNEGGDPTYKASGAGDRETVLRR